MDIANFLAWLEATALATRIRDSLLLFPLLEAFHVIGLALVFGTIAVIDLRLLGLASASRPFHRTASETLKWTWAAFALTALTGVLMFITNAGVYYHNFYFRSKMVLLLLAGINTLAFELTTARDVQRWNTARAAPTAGKAAAIVSLTVWIAIIFAGRLIGFTTSRAAAPPPPTQEINFEELLGTAPETPEPLATPPPK
jgi:hypothetical protein